MQLNKKHSNNLLITEMQYIIMRNKQSEKDNNSFECYKKEYFLKLVLKIQLQIHFHSMDSQPRWLDIQDELYPHLTIIKQIIFQDASDNQFTQFYSEINYNSYKREIDLTPIVYKYFIHKSSQQAMSSAQNTMSEIYIKGKHQELLHFIGSFPNDDAFILGEQFLSEEILYLIVKAEEKINNLSQNQSAFGLEKLSVSQYMQEPEFKFQEKQELSEQQELQQQEEQFEQNQKIKTNKRRTIEEILKIVAQWRKLIMLKKLSSVQAAQKVGMSKRSLDDYFTTIKLGEKYDFDFQGKMKCGFGDLRNFVKERHETKPTAKVQILEKFKNIKK